MITREAPTSTTSSTDETSPVDPMRALWQHVYGDQVGYISLFSGVRVEGHEKLQRTRTRHYPWPDEVDKVLAWIDKNVAEGREVYVCPHLVIALPDDKDGIFRPDRTKKHAAPMVALYADADGATVPKHLPAPTVVMRTSPGREQLYWKLSRSVSPEFGEQLNKRLTYAMGADPSGWNLAKLLRVPSTPNYKYTDTPTVTLTYIDDSTDYDPDELDRILPQLPAAPAPSMETRDTISTILKRSDDDVISQILAIPKAARLWHGDDSDYNGDASAGDLAFLNIIRNLAGGNVEQMDHAFRRSLRMRDKWNTIHSADGHTYGEMTLARSLTNANGTTAPRAATAPQKGGPATAVQSTEATMLQSTDVSGAYHRTDAGSARRFVDQHGDRIRYCATEKRWYLYDGKRWVADSTEGIRRLVAETARTMYHEAAELEDRQDREAAIKWALQLEKAKPVRDLLYMAEADARVVVTPDQFDTDGYTLNVRNGTINLRTGELRPHNPADLLTKLAPVNFDPDACLPLWDRHLETVIPDAETREAVQRATGYSATGDDCEEKLFFVHGGTATGKSTTLLAIARTLGDYAKQVDFSTFTARKETGGPRSDLVRLRGARFVVSSEVDDGKRLAEGLVKGLSGGDTLIARDLYAREQEITPTWSLWLTANDRPRVRPDDTAMWRRVVEIPFDATIPEDRRDPMVKAVLTDPAQAGAAILAWIVRGCLAWQRDGLLIPERIKAATASYRAEMDAVGDWIADRCIVSDTAKASAEALYASYVEWCRATGEGYLTATAFGKQLKAKGFTSDRTNRGRSWLGLGLYDDPQQVSFKVVSTKR